MREQRKVWAALGSKVIFDDAAADDVKSVAETGSMFVETPLKGSAAHAQDLGHMVNRRMVGGQIRRKNLLDLPAKIGRHRPVHAVHMSLQIGEHMGIAIRRHVRQVALPDDHRRARGTIFDGATEEMPLYTEIVRR